MTGANVLFREGCTLGDKGASVLRAKIPFSFASMRARELKRIEAVAQAPQFRHSEPLSESTPKWLASPDGWPSGSEGEYVASISFSKFGSCGYCVHTGNIFQLRDDLISVT